MTRRKRSCGKYLMHKFRVGKDGPRQRTCLRCGHVHADVARAERIKAKQPEAQRGERSARRTALEVMIDRACGITD